MNNFVERKTAAFAARIIFSSSGYWMGNDCTVQCVTQNFIKRRAGIINNMSFIAPSQAAVLVLGVPSTPGSLAW